MNLKEEQGYLPDLEELRRLVGGGVKMICINNPNNPTGAPYASGVAGAVDHSGACTETFPTAVITDSFHALGRQCDTSAVAIDMR